MLFGTAAIAIRRGVAVEKRRLRGWRVAVTASAASSYRSAPVDLRSAFMNGYIMGQFAFVAVLIAVCLLIYHLKRR